jgi:PAP2 superfamily
MNRLPTSFFRLHCPPSDRLVLLLLALSVVVALTRLPWTAPPGPLLELLVIQACLLVGFGLAVLVLTLWEHGWWVRFLRPLVTVAVIFTCYTTLGRLGVVAMPYLADGWLSWLDTRLFGTNPTFFLQPYLTPGRVEFFSFFYGAFIPYIYLTIALNCLGQPPVVRDQFLTGWVILYFVSYLGYIFLPGQGPGAFHEHEFAVPLSGGTFYHMVVDGVAATGGLQGAFPSLHVGGSLYLCLFELRTNRLRGLIYLPLVVLIYGATLVLRYHYVVDLIAGTVLAAVCLPLGRLVFDRWVRRRQLAGLPALPGGEGDVLSVFPPVHEMDAARIFSSD